MANRKVVLHSHCSPPTDEYLRHAWKNERCLMTRLGRKKLVARWFFERQLTEMVLPRCLDCIRLRLAVRGAYALQNTK